MWISQYQIARNVLFFSSSKKKKKKKMPKSGQRGWWKARSTWCRRPVSIIISETYNQRCKIKRIRDFVIILIWVSESNERKYGSLAKWNGIYYYHLHNKRAGVSNFKQDPWITFEFWTFQHTATETFNGFLPFYSISFQYWIHEW